MPLWIVSIDLKKAFDRVDHNMLFHSLAEQNCDKDLILLLQMLYKYQKGIVGDNEFGINRGVRQGDILSPILFNAVLEHALGRWKDGLLCEGFALDGNMSTERLTNLRYADDLLLFGQSLDEAISMLDSLTEILRVYGLELNLTKTKVLTTECTTENTQICITKYGSVEIVGSNSKHKYLGRGFVGELRHRGKAAVDHRLSCAWMEYKMYQHVFENKDVSLALRLKLFQSIITPTLCYSLDTCPLTEVLKNRLDVTQRVMFRRMIGSVSSTGDTWEERGRKMKVRLERALTKYPVEDWSTCIYSKKVSLVSRVNELPAWTKAAFNWDPLVSARLNLVQPYRCVGRPLSRWNDGIVPIPRVP